MEALYYAKTGDVAYKEAAYRTYNWVTYFQGLSAEAHAPYSTQWWFTDEFSDGPRRVMDAFWAVPLKSWMNRTCLIALGDYQNRLWRGRGDLFDV